MKKVFSFLRQEIIWGRLAGIAVVTAALFVLSSGSALGMVGLLGFSVGGIVVGRMASRRPFWNGLFYGLLAIAFTAALLILYTLGNEGRPPSGAGIGGALLYASVLILPQAIVGVGISAVFRRFRDAGERMAAARKGEAEAKPGGEAGRGKKEAPAGGEKQRPRAGSTRRPGKGEARGGGDRGTGRREEGKPKEQAEAGRKKGQRR